MAFKIKSMTSGFALYTAIQLEQSLIYNKYHANYGKENIYDTLLGAVAVYCDRRCLVGYLG